MHSRSSKQANEITLIENDVVITDKKEVAELFKNYFVHIVDDVQDIKEHKFGNEFSTLPSILAIVEENRRKNAIHNFNFKVIPWFCIAHSYCARFLRHQHAHMSARAYKT